MSAAASASPETPWEARISNALVGYFADPLVAQAACDQSPLLKHGGLVFVTHEFDGTRWFKDPERGWRPFVPRNLRKGIETERWPLLRPRADIDG